MIFKRFALALDFLMCQVAAVSVFAAGPPTIQIDSVSPDGPWFPGDSLKITMKVTYSDAPYPGTVDFVVREVGDAGIKEVISGVSGSQFSIEFNQRSATKTLSFPFYYVPASSCMYDRSAGRPLCPYCGRPLDPEQGLCACYN